MAASFVLRLSMHSRDRGGKREPSFGPAVPPLYVPPPLPPPRRLLSRSREEAVLHEGAVYACICGCSPRASKRKGLTISPSGVLRFAQYTTLIFFPGPKGGKGTAPEPFFSGIWGPRDGRAPTLLDWLALLANGAPALGTESLARFSRRRPARAWQSTQRESKQRWEGEESDVPIESRDGTREGVPSSI